jgi:hypothetical protein
MQATTPTPPASPKQSGCLCFGKGKPAPKTTETIMSVADPAMKQGIVASPAGHWNAPGRFTEGAPMEYKPMPGPGEGSK